MKVDFEDLGGLKYKMKITVEAADLARHKSRLAKNYAHHVNIPGFRPGKAPLELVARKLGPELDAEVQENAISQAMREVLESRKLKPSTDPKMEIGARNDDGSFDFTVEFESFPDVDVKDYLGVQVTEPVVPEITDEDITGSLDRMREQMAKFEEKAADSVGNEADMAVVDLTVMTVDGETVLLATRESRIVVGTDDEPVAAAGRELLGLKVGETATVTGPVGRITARDLPADETASGEPVETPEGETPAEPVTRTVKATLTIKRLMERRPPEMDETFAKRLGTDSLDDLRLKVRERLEAERAEHRKDLLKEAILNAIAAANPVEVGAETITRLADLAEDEAKGRMLPGLTAEQRAGIDLGIPREKSEAEARENLVRMVLLQTIAEKEGIQVSEDDIEGHLRGLAAEHHVPLPKLKAHFDEEKLDNLARRLRVDKTVDMLLRYAVVAPASDVIASTPVFATDDAPAPAPEATPEVTP
jgi:trigger factor